MKNAKELVRAEIDAEVVKRKTAAAAAKAREAVAVQALEDSNNYVRKETGELARSSERASDLKEGLLVWDTPYARRVYYTGDPSGDENPGASLMWAHKAAAENLEKWLKTGWEEFLRNMS